MVKKLADKTKKITKSKKDKSLKSLKIKPPSRVSQVVGKGGGQRTKLEFRKLGQDY
jgi:hypothetical protein